MSTRLRLGIVGLGRLWDARHKPALGRLRDRFEVVCVYDQVARRAVLEARQVGCRTSDSLVAMVSSPDIDAIYVLSPQWFGWHAVDLAAEHGKPVYCALPPAAHASDLRRTAERLACTGAAFMPELPRRVYPATLRLRELIETRLGRPRLVVGQSRLFGYDRYGEPGPTTQLAQTALVIDPGSNLIDWCRFVFGEEPARIQRTAGTLLPTTEAAWGPDYESLSLQFPGGAVAHLWMGRYHQDTWGEASRFLPGPGFQVYAERGVAWLEMPDRIQWTDDRGVHEERLAMEPTVGERLSEQFRRKVQGESSAAPDISDALLIAEWVERVQERTGGAPSGVELDAV
jgi:predicted dehydrogenase